MIVCSRDQQKKWATDFAAYAINKWGASYPTGVGDPEIAVEDDLSSAYSFKDQAVKPLFQNWSPPKPIRLYELNLMISGYPLYTEVGFLPSRHHKYDFDQGDCQNWLTLKSIGESTLNEHGAKLLENRPGDNTHDDSTPRQSFKDAVQKLGVAADTKIRDVLQKYWLGVDSDNEKPHIETLLSILLDQESYSSDSHQAIRDAMIPYIVRRSPDRKQYSMIIVDKEMDPKKVTGLSNSELLRRRIEIASQTIKREGGACEQIDLKKDFLRHFGKEK